MHIFWQSIQCLVLCPGWQSMLFHCTTSTCPYGEVHIFTLDLDRSLAGNKNHLKWAHHQLFWPVLWLPPSCCFSSFQFCGYLPAVASLLASSDVATSQQLLLIRSSSNKSYCLTVTPTRYFLLGIISSNRFLFSHFITQNVLL